VNERGVVLSIQLSKVHGQLPVPVEETRALVGHGLEGDSHGKRRPNTGRQVVLADRRTLEAFGFAHGALREQLTVDFPGLDTLVAGTRLRVGEAVLEVSGPCDPCVGIGTLNGVEDPYALRDALAGRRGMSAKVVAVIGTGLIRRGDMLVVEAGLPTAATERVPG
jgi:MOSC domain-containing protein YiiM